jgi:hypothetical protein
MSQLSDRYKQSTTSGTWRMRQSGVVYWESVKDDFEYDLIMHQFVKKQSVVSELSPEESPFKCKKEMLVDVCLMREKEDLNSVSGKSMYYYVRKMKFAVRPDFPNVWLTLGKDNRLYCKDLIHMTTYKLDPMSDLMVKVTKLSEKRISKEDALQLKTGYVFSRIEQLDDNTESLGMYVKPAT